MEEHNFQRGSDNDNAGGEDDDDGSFFPPGLFDGTASCVSRSFSIPTGPPSSDAGEDCRPADGYDIPTHLSICLSASRAASTDHDLTGLIVWPVSVLLAHYAASPRGRAAAAGGRICELGAGCGLPGLTAAAAADGAGQSDGAVAPAVVLTDGSAPVAEVMGKNVRRRGGGGRTEVDATELLWGSHGEGLRRVLGMLGGGSRGGVPSADLVLGADVVQWPAVVEPLLLTVKALLWGSSVEHRRRQRDGGAAERGDPEIPPPVFALGMVRRSTQTSELFFRHAKTLGFVCKKLNYADFYYPISSRDIEAPEECREFGDRETEVYELHLEDLSEPSVLLTRMDGSHENLGDMDLTLGKDFQNTLSMPC